MKDEHGSRVIPCEMCGTPTSMLTTKRCDKCWELEARIRRAPRLARKILNKLERED